MRAISRLPHPRFAPPSPALRVSLTREFHEFRREFRVHRERVESDQIKLVRCGEGYGEIRPMESKYLEPEVHSLMEVKRYTVSPEDCGRMILLVDVPRRALKGTYALEYIEWGESKGWHKGATCAARVTDSREWYDLTGHKRGAALWPKERQYRHIAPANPERLIANCRLYEIYPSRNEDADLWGGILNSSWVLMASLQYGRPVGNEGNWSTMVVDANLMLVPDPAQAKVKACDDVAKAFKALKGRPAMQFLSKRRLRRMDYIKAGREKELAGLSDLSELDLDDRRALDDAILEMLGVKSQRERNDLIDRLYAYLREYFEDIREKEEKAIANKNRSKRKGAASPPELANQLLADIRDKHGRLLRSYSDFLDVSRLYSTFDLPVVGVAEVHTDMFAPQGSVRFMKGRKQIAIMPTKTREQAALVALIAAQGIRGLTRVPLDPQECIELGNRYEAFVKDRAQRLRSMIAERTRDPDLQDRIFDALISLVSHEASVRI